MQKLTPNGENGDTFEKRKRVYRPRQPKESQTHLVKIICLGDTATGKSKMMERFLMDKYSKNQASTFALTFFTHETELDGDKIIVDFWDTAGQERFEKVHPSYYHEAHCCILVFDATRRITYKSLEKWYKAMRSARPKIPCIIAANKIDEDDKVIDKTFAFSEKYNLPIFYVSAADGTNIVKLFRESIKLAVGYKKNPTDFTDQILNELRYQMEKKPLEKLVPDPEKDIEEDDEIVYGSLTFDHIDHYRIESDSESHDGETEEYSTSADDTDNEGAPAQGPKEPEQGPSSITN